MDIFSQYLLKLITHGFWTWNPSEILDFTAGKMATIFAAQWLQRVVIILMCLLDCAQFFRKGQATNPSYIYLYVWYTLFIYRCICNYIHNELDNFWCVAWNEFFGGFVLCHNKCMEVEWRPGNGHQYVDWRLKKCSKWVGMPGCLQEKGYTGIQMYTSSRWV